MKKRVKILIIINLLYYLSYYIYTYAQYKIEIKGIFVILAFLPHLLLIISSFIIFHYDKDMVKLLRIESIFDFIIRGITFFVNFRITVLDKFSEEFKLMMAIMIISFIINILLEFIMYRKVELNDGKKEKVNYSELPWAERRNYNDMYKAATSSWIEIPVIMIVIITLLGFNKNSSTSSIIGLSLINLFVLRFVLKHSYDTLQLFYKDNAIAKKAFIKENAYVMVNLLLGVIFAFSRLIGYGDEIKFVLFVIQMLFLYPNLKYRSERARIVLKIKNAKENKE